MFLITALAFCSCSKKTYSFKKTVDDIKSIEIVFAESSLDYTVLKTLSNVEKNDFIDQFQKIEFHNYYVGDPMSVTGNAVKITYYNGDYEIICYFWSEYVKNGEVYYVRKSCDEKMLTELIDSFLQEP